MIIGTFVIRKISHIGPIVNITNITKVITDSYRYFGVKGVRYTCDIRIILNWLKKMK